MGHDVVAAACTASLASRGWTSDTQDAMALLGGSAHKVADSIFRRILAVPPLYDALHFSVLRTGSGLARAMDRAAAGRLVPVVEELLDRQKPDLVLSTFSTGAGVVNHIKARRPRLVSAVICTDVTAHRLWVHPRTDLFLVTSEAAAASVRRFRPDAPVALVPFPLRPGFYHPPTQAEARATLGIPDDERCVLLMSGGWGLGPIARTARALGDAEVNVLAVAGRNPALAARLRAVSAEQPRVVSFGFTDRVAELMAACDLVVTSSGDTCSEARALGRDMLLLDVVPGHGRENLQHELELGRAGVTSADPEQVVPAALAALDRVCRPGPGVSVDRRTWEEAFAAALDRLGFDGV
ncbi:MAG: MGDG synthase family glycosyltransferase [Acidimicrobiales bacterium]